MPATLQEDSAPRRSRFPLRFGRCIVWTETLGRPVMNRLLPARRWIALTFLLAAFAAPALSLSVPFPTSTPDASAVLFVSPNTRDDLDLAAARLQLDSADHARYRRLAGDLLSELGVREH